MVLPKSSTGPLLVSVFAKPPHSRSFKASLLCGARVLSFGKKLSRMMHGMVRFACNWSVSVFARFRGARRFSVKVRGVLPAAERPPSYPLWPAAHLDEIPRLVGSETDLIGERVSAPRTALPLSLVFEYLHEASSAAGLEHEAAPMPGEIEYVPSVRFEPDARVISQTVVPGRVLSFKMLWVPRFGRDKLA